MKSWKVDDGVAKHLVAPQKLDSEPAMEKAERQHHLYCGVPKSQKAGRSGAGGKSQREPRRKAAHLTKSPPRTPPTQPSAQQTTAPPSA